MTDLQWLRVTSSKWSDCCLHCQRPAATGIATYFTTPFLEVALMYVHLEIRQFGSFGTVQGCKEASRNNLHLGLRNKAMWAFMDKHTLIQTCTIRLQHIRSQHHMLFDVIRFLHYFNQIPSEQKQLDATWEQHLSEEANQIHNMPSRRPCIPQHGHGDDSRCLPRQLRCSSRHRSPKGSSIHTQILEGKRQQQQSVLQSARCAFICRHSWKMRTDSAR